MSRHRRLLPLLLPLLIASLAWAAVQVQSVQIRSGQLRERPSFLGRTLAQVAYGDRLTVLETTRGWARVRDAAGVTGWIHGSALSEKRIVLQTGDRDLQTAASGEEIALAGKGFNEQVEAEFKAENPQIDYTWVDFMERSRVTAEEARAFLEAGRVVPPAGGAS